jgi:hypothetical protein
MSFQYAAHVDHPISHHDETVALTVAAIGVLATITIVATGGTAGLIIIATTAAGLANDAASAAEKALPVEEGAGQIATGLPSVLLGESVKPAARADAGDCVSKICHVAQMFQGSQTVMIGPGNKPMSRRGDQVAHPCAGTISDGNHTIMVGGKPSHEGVVLDEGDSMLLHGMKMSTDAAGGVATIVKGGLVSGLTQLLAVGH